MIMAVASLACYGIEAVERRSEQAQLRERASAIASALERRANANAAYLRAGAALFATLGDAPAGDFRRFVSELRLDTDYRGSEGIGWAQRVDPDQVAAFDEMVGDEYGEDVNLRPALAPGQEYAMPVTFLEPDTDRNRRALGFDMYSQQPLRLAMMEAERTARPSASGKIRMQLVGNEGVTGFLMFMPVFDPVPGGARLRGFVYGAFGAQDFLASALLIATPGELDIRLYDREVSEDSLLASIDAGPRGQDDGLSAQEELAIADHPWVLVVSNAKTAPLSPLSTATLLFGLGAAILLALLARVMTRQAEEDGARLAWFEEQNAIRDSLTRELNHRVKNTLANVLSIVALTKRRAKTLQEFTEGLEGRIRALSATHDLLTKSDWGATPIGALVEAELAPYAREFGPSMLFDGPDIDLAPNDALSLGLAIHELATNAAKYGALTTPEGKLIVRWSLVDGGARVEWTETDGPPVPAERNRGFGTELIEKIVANELKHPVELRFEPDGVRCTLMVPVRRSKLFELRDPGSNPPSGE